MVNLERALVEGLGFSLLMSLIILVTLVINPRLWLQDYPEAIKILAAPLSESEKQMRRWVTGPVLLAALLVPYLSANAAAQQTGASFWSVLLHTLVVVQLFNLVDAVVIDGLILALLQPKFALIREAWGHPALRDTHKLVGDFFKGVVICSLLALVIAGAAWLV
jgi:hypothetical protein